MLTKFLNKKLITLCIYNALVIMCYTYKSFKVSLTHFQTMCYFYVSTWANFSTHDDECLIKYLHYFFFVFGGKWGFILWKVVFFFFGSNFIIVFLNKYCLLLLNLLKLDFMSNVMSLNIKSCRWQCDIIKEFFFICIEGVM